MKTIKKNGKKKKEKKKKTFLFRHDPPRVGGLSASQSKEIDIV